MLRNPPPSLLVRGAAPALLAALFLWFPWDVSPLLAEAIGLPFLVAFTVLLPGAALTRILRIHPRDGAQAAALWTVHGLFVLMACAFVWALLEMTMDGFALLLAAVVTALAVAMPRRDPTRVPPAAPARARVERYVFLSMVGLVTLTASLVYVAGAPVDFNKDTLDYVAYANEVAVTGDATPVTEFYADPGIDGADLRKGMLHSVYGFYHARLGLDTLRIFALLAALMLVAVTLSVYAAALSMFGDGAIAALAAILFLLCYEGGPGGSLLRTWFYPSHFGLVALLAYTAAALEFLRRPTARGFILGALYGFTAAAIHIQYVVLLGFVAAILVVCRAASPGRGLLAHLSGVVQIGAAAFFGFLPYAAFRYVTAYQTNALHKQVQGAVYVFDHAFVVDPVRAWQSVGVLGVAAAFSLVPAWRLRKRYPAAAYLVAAVLVLVLVQFNPVVLPVLYDFITYLIYRLPQAVPWYMLPAVIVVAMFRRQGGVAGRFVLSAVGVAAVVAVAAGIVALGEGAGPAARAYERDHSYKRWSNGLDDLARLLPPGSVIASDPVTSYTITAFTPHKVLCTLDQHAPPNDRLAVVRMSAARDILGPFTPADARVALADTFGVTHIVLNQNLPRGMTLDYWAMAPSVVEHSRAEFDRWADAFERLPVGDSLLVYRVTGAVPPAQRSSAADLIGDPPAQAVSIDQPAGAAVLVAARLGSRVVSPGDGLDIDLYWSRHEPLSDGTYIAYIRMDHTRPGLPLDGLPFPKVTRKIKEKIEGRRYRARFEHMPTYGFFSPPMWPIGAIVADYGAVRIPQGLASGTWEVRAILLRVAHVPNVRLRDFFFDDDTYNGTLIGHVEVEQSPVADRDRAR